MENTQMSEPAQADREHLAHLVALGEKAYDEMYDAHDQHAADTSYRDAKDAYYDAIGLARRLGLSDQVEKLEERLLHIKAVYRSQFWQG
jgi:hypothetical protein